MTALLLRTLWRPVALLLAVLGIYAKGRSSARRDARAEAAEDNIATRRRMDDALDGLDGNDPDAARRFLRERGKRPGDL